jgi:hypothetical protein
MYESMINKPIKIVRKKGGREIRKNNKGCKNDETHFPHV